MLAYKYTMSFNDVLSPPSKYWATLYVNNVVTPSGQLGAGFTGPTGASSNVPGPTGSSFTGPTGASSSVTGPTGSSFTGPTGNSFTGPTGPAFSVSGGTGNSIWSGIYSSQIVVPISYRKAGQMVTLFVSEYADTAISGSPGTNFPLTMTQPYLVGPYQPLYTSYGVISVLGGTGSTGTTGGTFTAGMAKLDPSGIMQIFYTPNMDGFPLNGNRAGWNAFTLSYIVS